MENAVYVGNIILTCAPSFSALTWELILLLSLKDSLSFKEIRLKKTLLSFFFFSAISWASLFIYVYLPQYFMYVNSLAYLSFLTAPVLFYKFITEITENVESGGFSWLHFVFPVFIGVTLFIWSFFVPADVQHSLVLNRGEIYPGWEAYSRFFLSKPFVRFIINIIYTVLTIICLYRNLYHIRANQENSAQIKHWHILLLAFTVTLFLTSIVTFFMPRSELFQSIIFVVIVCLFISQHIVITYMVIRRDFFTLGVTEPFEEDDLTEKKLENWIRKYKPYLDPDLKLSDFSGKLRIDAYKLSKFINNAYGMTFSRYMNLHRLREVQRLGRLPSNTGKTIHELADMAGFSSYRKYVRTRNLFDNTNNSEKSDDRN